MGSYLLRRLLYLVPTIFLISVVSFLIIQLPPGSYLDTVIAEMAAEGQVDETRIAVLEQRYGLDEPLHVQYFSWVGGMLHGDFGESFLWNAPVSELIGSRLLLSIAISLCALLVTWMLAFPIGIYSAVRRYSFGDYAFTMVGFVGLAVPEFLLGLGLAYVAFTYFGQDVGGLFSPEFQDSAWNLGKVLDLLSNVWMPVVVVGAAGTAALIRTLRSTLLDELAKPYVDTARAKGLTERRLLLKYPVRMALGPFLSTVGWVLPALVSGEVVVSIVFNLPTTGPLLLQALKAQDMYLAGSFIMILSLLTVLGTLLSDLLLAWSDPRIRYGNR
jgi:peptide/nickel transport system permease protein